MRLKSVEQPSIALKYFKDEQDRSQKNIHVLKSFLLAVHKLTKKFGEDLQHLYSLLMSTEDEESLVQNTTLSNYVLSISQVLKNKADILYEESIEPFLQFEDNYRTLNTSVYDQFAGIIATLKTNHAVLALKQTEYLEKRKQEEQYHLSLKAMNYAWEKYFNEVPQHFESFQLNEESRLSIQEQTIMKFVDNLEDIFMQSGALTKKRLKASFKSQKQRLRSRDLYSEMTVSSKRMFDFMMESKCDVFMSWDDYHKQRMADLLSSAEQQKNEGLTEDDLKILRLNLDQHVVSNLPFKIRLIPHFNQKVREEVLNSLIPRANSSLSLPQSQLYKILLLRFLKATENDAHMNAQQLLQIMQLGLLLRERNRSLLGIVSQQCDLFYQYKTWAILFAELQANVQYQRIMLELTERYVNLSLSIVNNIPKPKIEDQKLISYFTQKLKPISALDALYIVNMMLIATEINPAMSSTIVIELLRSQGIRLIEAIQFIELQEGNAMLKGIRVHRSNKRSPGLTALMKCLKYINYNVMPLLLLNKEISRDIRRKLISYRLIYRQGKRNAQRVIYWELLLESDTNLETIRQKYITSSKKLSREVEHSIIVDIRRSFNTTSIDRDAIVNLYEHKLESLLRFIAFCNPEVAYFQGMNMLMVFFLKVTELDETRAFKMFQSLLESMLKDIFLDGLKSMKLHFYILDRLIALFIPKLFIYWRSLKIECPQFATPWYVTLFTHAVQLDDDLTNDTCFSIFDIILAKQWAGFYSVTVSILLYYEQDLLKMDFDRTHKFLNSLTKSSFNLKPPREFMDIYPFTDIKKRLIRIRKSTIKEIEKEYYSLREKLDLINNNKL